MKRKARMSSEFREESSDIETTSLALTVGQAVPTSLAGPI